ncbi:MAG: thiamine pyrophosphate-dependent dehydrogenase E1 component subunit alpha [Candidatus Krumholzibacteria bacterium]|nr:thiamine pyrophosphate-dependent dehydrogenase E1 component subunit alpha [Candidatus Krumholzibacteria bacterium]
MSTAKPSTSKEYRIEAPDGLDLGKHQFVELYHYIALNRRLEERLSILYRQNKIVGGLYSSLGQEATSVGSAYALADGDFLAPMIRNLGSYLVRGVSAKDFVAQYLARECSPTRGKDGTQHFGDLSKGLIACISMLGALVPVMAGVAMAMKHRGQKNVALTYCGDGATSTTDFHEGLNFAAVHRVPFILVAEHNQYAYATPVSMQFTIENIADKAPAYGVHGEIVDGNNVLAVYDATRRARQMCIEGKGPVLLEAKTFRRKGHAEHDPADYVPKKLRAQWEAKDPLDAYSRFLLDQGVATRSEMDDVDAKITRELELAVQEVLDSPFPDKSIADRDVYFSARTDGGSHA